MITVESCCPSRHIERDNSCDTDSQFAASITSATNSSDELSSVSPIEFLRELKEIPGLVGTLLASSLMNISQCGPAFYFFDTEAKFSSTLVCNATGFTVFPIHCEAGHPVHTFMSGFKTYALGLFQCGFRVNYNGSRNPKDWSVCFVTEKLEHFEFTVPLWSVETQTFAAAGQTLFGFECGKTTTFDKRPGMEFLDQILCRTPTAILELFQNAVIRPCTGNQDISPRISPISSQPSSFRNPCNLVNFLADAITRTLRNALASNNPDEVFWTGATIGLCDINAGFTLDFIKVLKAKYLLTNYLRHNIMFTYINGEFSIPDNVKIFIIIMYKILGSCRALHHFLNNLKVKVVENFPHNQSIHTAISNLTDKLAASVDESPLEDIPLREFLYKLAVVSTNSFVVNNKKGVFEFGYNSAGQELKENYRINDKDNVYILGGTEKNEKEGSNVHRVSQYTFNADILHIITNNNEASQGIVSQILSTQSV